MSGSVSEDEGGILSQDRALNMSSQVRYVKSGVGGSTVRSIVESETGRRRLKIWIMKIFESLMFF